MLDGVVARGVRISETPEGLYTSHQTKKQKQKPKEGAEEEEGCRSPASRSPTSKILFNSSAQLSSRLQHQSLAGSVTCLEVRRWLFSGLGQT